MSAGVATTVQREVNWRRPVSILLQLLGVVVFLLLVPFAFGMEWSNFQSVLQPLRLRFLGFGVLVTVVISLAAILASLPLATALALGRLSKIAAVRWPCTAFIEVVRALPLLLLIFYINLRFPGLDMFERLNIGGGSDDFVAIEITRVLSQPALAVALALTLYTAAVNAELLRSGILSLERGQTEAARSLGLTYRQTMQRVILPQAYRRILAPLIAQFTILLKDTSLGSIIGLVELQRRAVILYNRDFNPLETLFVVAILYFVLNYLLGLTSKLVQRKQPSIEVRMLEF
jgi:aspartate/glutamate/glutamine transport system permease protein